MGLLLLFQGLYQNVVVTPPSYLKEIPPARMGPLYVHADNSVSGSVLGAAPSTINTVLQFTTTRRTLIHGYDGTGTADGLFFLEIGGVVLGYRRTNAVYPNAKYQVEKDKPIVVDSGVLVKLRVNNISTGLADYYGNVEVV